MNFRSPTSPELWRSDHENGWMAKIWKWRPEESQLQVFHHVSPLSPENPHQNHDGSPAWVRGFLSTRRSKTLLVKWFIHIISYHIILIPHRILSFCFLLLQRKKIMKNMMNTCLNVLNHPAWSSMCVGEAYTLDKTREKYGLEWRPHRGFEDEDMSEIGGQVTIRRGKETSINIHEASYFGVPSVIGIRLKAILVGGLEHLFFHIIIGNNHPNWLILFKGLKPPTRIYIYIYL